ncbi:hypothetical protein RFI_39279, partial [Reticulomyxa filosa]
IKQLDEKMSKVSGELIEVKKVFEIENSALVLEAICHCNLEHLIEKLLFLLNVVNNLVVIIFNLWNILKKANRTVIVVRKVKVILYYIVLNVYWLVRLRNTTRK